MRVNKIYYIDPFKTAFVIVKDQWKVRPTSDRPVSRSRDRWQVNIANSKLWSDIPFSIGNIESLDSFKKAVNNFFLSTKLLNFIYIHIMFLYFFNF